MATITIHIVFGGTPYRTENGTIQTSDEGHMFFELSGQTAQPNDSWGFQPSGVIPGEGNLYYQRDVSVPFDISDSQAQKVRDFATQAEENGNGVWFPGVNSCVDFVWDVLREAGITPANTWNPLAPIVPGYNVDRLKETYYEYLRRPEFNREFRKINPATNTAYRIARSANQGAQSPLVLDLDGDGIEIAQLPLGASTATRFDHNADGIRTGTAWVKGDDGLLVLDRNGNGAIDSGREAFGDNTLLASGQKAADGYAALADLDSNHDGQITALDSAFTQLQVWRDLDQDGISDSGELQTLTQAGITRIGLAKTASTQTLSDGTRLDGSASFTLNGQTRSYTDAWFAENAFYREFTDTIPLTAATLGVADAPQEVPLWDMQGAGMVRDLREAASLDATIVSDVQNLTGASRTQMMNGLDPLISHWADTSAFKTSIQTADDQGFKLVYLPPGMTVLDYWKIQGMMAGGTSGGTSPELSETERTRLDALKAQQETYVKMIGILERFNGLHFVTVNNGTSVTTAQGQGQLIEAIALPTGYVPPEATGTGVCAPIYAYVPLNVEQTPLLERSYAQLKDSVYDGLAIQTRLKPYLDTISLSIDASGIKIDYSGINSALDALYATDKIRAFTDCIDLTTGAGSLGWSGAQKLENWVNDALAAGQLDSLKAGLAPIFVSILESGPDFKIGTTGNDIFYSGSGDDVLLGNAGNDTLDGGAGGDVLDGGAGNDLLSGGIGADTYLFGIGSGQDMIYNPDSDALGSNPDTILLGAGLNPGNVTLTRSYDDLMISLNGTTDTLRVAYYFSTDATTSSAVENLKFADGTSWDIATVKNKVQIGTSGNDNLYGYATADSLSGGDGNDNLYGYAGNDTLNGGNGTDYLSGGDGNDALNGDAGADQITGGSGDDLINGGADNDNLSGEAGNDTLDGGAGSDFLTGGIGADTYLFGVGSGQDMIYNYDSDALGSNPDTILLGAGLNPGNVTLTRSYDDLMISLNGTTDTLRISAYFSTDATTSSAVENLKFADGTSWDIATVKNKVQIGTSGNDNLYGYATADSLSGGDGNDNLYGYAGNDTLNGGNGTDYLSGGDGNDALNGDAGADQITGGSGDDLINGGADNDNLSGEAGNDTLDGGAGSDFLTGGIGADTYLFGVGSGQDMIYNYDSDALGSNPDTILLGAGLNPGNVTLTRSYDDLMISLNGTTDTLRVAYYFSTDATTSSAVENLKFADGTSWDIATVKTKVMIGTSGNDNLYGYATADSLSGGDGNDSLNGYAGDDVLDGGNGTDFLYGGNDNDSLAGGAGADALYAGNGNDLLNGGADNDTLSGDAGNDLLEGGAGDDYLYDTAGTALFNGGAGTDTMTGGAGAEIYLGGLGNDTYTTGAGNDVILFNKGDGQDTFATGGSGSDTLSLGGVEYSDLAFSKASNDLVLKIGASDQITFKDWYAATPARPVLNLQVMAEAMAAFSAGGSDPLRNEKVENFNFAGLAGAFDSARAANTGLTSWALSSALASFQLAGSNSAALGGDLAYQYGRNGTLAGIGVTPALDVLNSAMLGASAQTLTPLAGLQVGAQRLS